MNAFLLQSHVLAQNIRNPAIGDLADLTGPEFLGRLIPALVSLGLVIGAIVFLFFFLTGAISWISSGGDKMKIEHARSKITTALIGLVILLSFMAIIGFVECFFGIGLREVSVGPFQINFSNVPMCGGGGSPPPPTPPTCVPCPPPYGPPCCDPGVCMGSFCAI